MPRTPRKVTLSVCLQAPSFGCGNGSQQVYGFYKNQIGTQISSSADNVTGPNTQYTYDEFNRLKTTNYNGQQTFSYSYDRYGNRWAENAPQGGPAPGFVFNTGTNQINGMQYDAAGNQLMNGPLSQGYNTYQYDAEGNQISVDSGQTAQYVYDAFNRRVWIHTNGNAAEQEPAYQEIDYDLNGKRLSIWDGSSGNLQKVQMYWGSQPVAFYTPGAIHFQHGDWLGSERVTTNYNGASELVIGHYPFGEIKYLQGNRVDAYEFGQLDHTDANTEHAQFREYENGQGHWLAPDPYSGSYNPYNPQSFNRYNYVGNNPLGFTDPTGLFSQPPSGDCGVCNFFSTLWNFGASLLGAGHPTLTASPGGPQARPNVKATATFGPTTTNPDGTTTIHVSYQTPPLNADSAQIALGLTTFIITHSRLALESNKSGFDYWNRQSTEAIIRSLNPGGKEPMQVRMDGETARIVNGNTRFSILQARGANLSGLNPEILPPVSLEPIIELPTDIDFIP